MNGSYSNLIFFPQEQIWDSKEKVKRNSGSQGLDARNHNTGILLPDSEPLCYLTQKPASECLVLTL